jgi:hypothetical protein
MSWKLVDVEEDVEDEADVMVRGVPPYSAWES